MKILFYSFGLFLLFVSVIEAQDTKVDILLEKVQQSKTKEEKNILISELKVELARINKKARDESNAIIDAKKKLPSKPFNVQNIIK